MHIETSGSARIKDRHTGEFYEIEADELEWMVVGEYERQMGPETEYAAVVHHEVLGELTWKLWEYPAGAENLQQQELNDHELIENFEISLEHDPDDYDPDDEADIDPPSNLYYSDDDAVGITPDQLRILGPQEQLPYLTYWFLQNYEDPANETPYDSEEGGYIYAYGGPFDAFEEISNEFSAIVSEDVIGRAVAEVERKGIVEWAPGPNLQEVDTDTFSPTRPPVTLQDIQKRLASGAVISFDNPFEREQRDQLIRQIADLEDALTRITGRHGGMGHNQPPEHLALTAVEKEELSSPLVVIRIELSKDEPNAQEVVEATDRFQKAWGWVVQKLDIYVDAAAKEAGKWTGKGLVGLVGLFIYGLLKWLNFVTLPF